MEAHAGKLHLGIGKSVTSNFSKANEQRDYCIFEEFTYKDCGGSYRKST